MRGEIVGGNFISGEMPYNTAKNLPKIEMQAKNIIFVLTLNRK
jgi:hypothetical protein